MYLQGHLILGKDYLTFQFLSNLGVRLKVLLQMGLVKVFLRFYYVLLDRKEHCQSKTQGCSRLQMIIPGL